MVKLLKTMECSINPEELLEIEFDNEMLIGRSTLEFRYIDTSSNSNPDVSVNFTDKQVSSLIKTLQEYLTNRVLNVYTNKGD